MVAGLEVPRTNIFLCDLVNAVEKCAGNHILSQNAVDRVHTTGTSELYYENVRKRLVLVKTQARVRGWILRSVRAKKQRQQAAKDAAKKTEAVVAIGTRFMKVFTGYGEFEGIVTAFDAKSGYYTVHYPEDDDEEDLSSKDLRSLLRGGAKAESGAAETNPGALEIQSSCSRVFQLTSGAIFSKSWAKKIAPLYDTGMGCEHMSRVLYSLVRFVKPKKVLEVGAGYTSIYILQAMRDNIEELVDYQKLHATGFKWPKLGWLVESYLKQYHHGRMYCIDNLEHAHTTADKVAQVAAELGLEDLMDIRNADAYNFSQELEEEEEEGALDMLWVDFGDGDRIDDFLERYWKFVNPNGGTILVHSTLTNSSSREWLARMKAVSRCGPGDTGEVATRAETFGLFDCMSLLEPHKERQNSVTMLQRRGFREELYSEPIYTKYA
jgi:predicted O-methyltransferase YrrM